MTTRALLCIVVFTAGCGLDPADASEHGLCDTGGSDAGPAIDGGRPLDAGVSADAGADAGTRVDAGSPVDAGAGSGWKVPAIGTSWQWQLSGTVNETVLDALPNPRKLYDIDLFNATPSLIARLKAKGIYVVCYMEAGDWSSSRPDSGDYAPSILGKAIAGFNEKFVDVRKLNGPAGPTGKTLAQIMRARLDLARARGCDGVEPDLDDLHTYNTGFAISQADMVAFNTFLVVEAHARGMSLGLKNGADSGGPGSFTAAMLAAGVDWALNEECNQYSECSGYRAFIAAGKPVFQVEYLDNQGVAWSGANGTCARNNAANFDGIVKDSSSTLAALPLTQCR